MWLFSWNSGRRRFPSSSRYPVVTVLFGVVSVAFVSTNKWIYWSFDWLTCCRQLYCCIDVMFVLYLKFSFRPYEWNGKLSGWWVFTSGLNMWLFQVKMIAYVRVVFVEFISVKAVKLSDLISTISTVKRCYCLKVICRGCSNPVISTGHTSVVLVLVQIGGSG